MDELGQKYDYHRKHDIFPCKKNVFVTCGDPGDKCLTCGWNPDVSWERKRKIRKQRKGGQSEND